MPIVYSILIVVLSIVRNTIIRIILSIVISTSYFSINCHDTDLDRLVQWDVTWQMAFNATKCMVMHITQKKKKSIIHNYKITYSTLEKVSKHPYLGITIMNNLSWSGQIKNNITKKESLSGETSPLPQKISSAMLYTFRICPHLENASAAWDCYRKGLQDQKKGSSRKITAQNPVSQQ